MSSRGKAKRQQKEARQAAARRDSQAAVKRLTLGVIGVIVLLGIAAVLLRGEGSASPRPGAVWSAEHGHWH